MITIAALGLAALGLVHVVVGWLAINVAWNGTGEEASAAGAFATMADEALGRWLLWACAIGLFGLAIWQLSEAIWGFRDLDGLELFGKRVASVGKASAYVALGLLAARATAGTGGGGQSEEGITARLLSQPAGPLLVGAIGVGIAMIATYLLHKGATKKFVRDLDGRNAGGRVGSAVIWFGQIGYIAKAIAYGIVAVLVITAAVRHDPEESGGLDEALATLRDQPYGQWLLTVVALGLVAFGLYAFGWARAMFRRRAEA